MASNPDPARRTLLRSLAAGACLALAPGTPAAEETQPVPFAENTRRVRTAPVRFAGAACISVELRDDEQRRVLRTGGNGPTYALVRAPFREGVIDVDVAAELTGRGARESRGFVGVAFHIDVAAETYEAVYLRMTNGRLNRPVPPAPRADRAIQYVAHPDFHYAVSRERFPGRYERGADVALGQWHHLRLEISSTRARALVDGHEALAIDELHYAGREGAVGLFIDDGTRGYFRGLRIVKAAL
jgi:hypothetical protein